MARDVRLRLIGLFLCAVALAAAYHQASTEAVMAESAQQFLASLTAEQKGETVFDFNSETRTAWHFVPDNNYLDMRGFPRKGLKYKQMTSEQRRLADALVASGLSQAGFLKAMKIMSLEQVLAIMENDKEGRRDPEGYHYSVFGKPDLAGTWGWRVEGHHISFNYTIKDGRLVSASPSFFGANPHRVPDGPRKGLRVLAREEDLGRAVVKSLDAEQRKAAVVADVAYKDILTSADTRAKLEKQPHGLPASKMNDSQVALLMDLLAEYVHNMPSPIAEARAKAVKETKRSELLFAWAGGIEPGMGDYYRVQAPTFLIEYDNTQNQNNHSHTVWRDFEGDFGRDVLAAHHRLYDHGLHVTVAAAD
jgi:hypothetical protein